MAEKNQQIAAQLQALARAAAGMDDEELIPVLLDTCSALMTEAEQRRPALADMDPFDLSGYTISYRNISGLVGQFADELYDISPDLDQDDAPEDVMQALEDLREIEREKRNQIRDLEDQIRLQKAGNDALEQEITQRRSELEQLRAFHTGMQDMAKSCTPEIILDQKQKNEELVKLIGSRQQQLDVLKQEKADKSADLEALDRQIQQIRKDIDALPASHRALVESYDAKCAELERLRSARETCSAEKQAQLEEQIRQLRPEVDQLVENTEILKSHHEEILNARRELDHENQLLRTDVLACIENAMADLHRLMGEHRQELEQIRTQAEVFRTSLAECSRIRKGLEQWIGSDRAQLNAVLEAIDRQENTNLRQTLDISAQESVKADLAQAGDALERVDRLLRRCALAAQKDQSIVKGKAGSR